MTTSPSDVAAAAKELLDEALELYHDSPTLEEGSIPGPSEIIFALQRVRRYLDRVEGINATCIRYRSALEQAHITNQGALDQRWDIAVLETAKDLEKRDLAPRERYAHYNFDAVLERNALRQTEKALSQVRAVCDVLYMVLRSLEGQRNDLHAMSRMINLDSRMER